MNNKFWESFRKIWRSKPSKFEEKRGSWKTPILTVSWFVHLEFNATLALLSNDKILDLTKFKAFADNKIIPTQKFKFILERVENIVRKGENAGYQHFLLFPQCFKSFLLRVLKVGIVW